MRISWPGIRLFKSVHSTREEKSRALPGDTRIPHAIDTLTHAITIRRAPRGFAIPTLRR